MHRLMENKLDGSIVRVYAHIITRHFWEYYILDNEKSDLRFALVIGDEQELGDVSMSEIAPYIVSRTDNLNEVMCAPGWKWVR